MLYGSQVPLSGGAYETNRLICSGDRMEWLISPGFIDSATKSMRAPSDSVRAAS